MDNETATEVMERRQREKLAAHGAMYGAGTQRLSETAYLEEMAARQEAVLRAREVWTTGADVSMSELYAQHAERQRARGEVIELFNALLATAKGDENKVLRGLFQSWWASYRVGSASTPGVKGSPRSVYSDDPMERGQMMAEVRIAFAKCIETARQRERLRAERARQRATWGRHR